MRFGSNPVGLVRCRSHGVLLRLPDCQSALWWIDLLLIGLSDGLVFSGSHLQQSGTVLLVLSGRQVIH
jgi:hypothetical protein